MTKYIGDWLQSLELRLCKAELDESSFVVRKLWHAIRVMLAVIRDILDGQISLHAMSLVYTTLLSIAPFFALSFSVLKGFGVHNQLQPVLEQILIAPLGPDRGPVAVQKILTFVDNIEVGVLGSVGLALLIYTVISLVQKIEYSFNQIWRISQSRSLAQRFSNYLSVIMIGPVLIFAALGVTAALVNSDPVQQITSSVEPLEWLFGAVGTLLPYAMVIGLFTFLYAFIPNTKVKLRHAFAGGAVAGVIWQTAGFAFTIFAADSTSYDAIYSGFAVAIMVLIWLYLAWLILLIGASVSYYARHAQQISRTRFAATSASLDEYAGLAIVYCVAKQFDRNGGGTNLADIESDMTIDAETLQRITWKLIRHNLMAAAGTENEKLIPARSLDRITLKQVLYVVRSPEGALPVVHQSHTAVTNVVSAIDDAVQGALLEKTVSEWVREEHNPVAEAFTTEPSDLSTAR